MRSFLLGVPVLFIAKPFISNMDGQSVVGEMRHFNFTIVYDDDEDDEGDKDKINEGNEGVEKEEGVG
ncbi:hypothetical protein H920_11190 [Fukomys damarensis]|uniref:Uncharacterized protein n=1 Tax=Fukomys damarensis TaxID=885580 RepID=A0A091D5K1_FUKDA|nr:hypothetical protein H920_11190 [Fukomys damarensis]